MNMQKKIPTNSNLEAAVVQIADTTGLTISPIDKVEDGPAGTSVLIRTTEASRERWRKAAEVSGQSMSAWIRDILDARATELLDCQHPAFMLKIYPWAKICTQCNTRL
jgi:Protein of unknown function (DUF1778)